jgi:hypothetical protein
MIKSLKIATAAALALTISACSGNDAPDSGKVTETRMDDVDVIDGTISDDMVDVDTIKEVDATGAETADTPDKKADAAPAAESDSTEE